MDPILDNLLRSYGLPGAVVAVMGWLIKIVMKDAQDDRKTCAAERAAFLVSLNEHAVRDTEVLGQIRETLVRIGDRLANGAPK